MVKWTEFSFILKPSPVGGVGVFAAHDIPAGTQVFTAHCGTRRMKVKDIPGEFIKYCVFINDEECLCPERFDRMEVGWFLNHSHTPNIRKVSDDVVFAARDIKEGEEILLDYNQLNEPEHLKDAYYKKS